MKGSSNRRQVGTRAIRLREVGQVFEADSITKTSGCSVGDACEDGWASGKRAGGYQERVIDGRASRAANSSKGLARCLQGLSIKVAKTDANHTVFQGARRSKGLSQRGTERMKKDRGAHEESIFEAYRLSVT